jgi:hypothetical protein
MAPLYYRALFNMAEYGNWTVQQIKSELSRRGAALTGRKNYLIER